MVEAATFSNEAGKFMHSSYGGPNTMQPPPRLLQRLGGYAITAVLGQGAMSWLLQRHSVSVVTPLTLAAPVISVFTASWYFGTPVTAVMLIGGGMAMLGVAVITIRTARAGERP